MLLIGNPIHAILDGTIGNTRRRSRTPGATFRDDGEFLGFLLPRRVDPHGLGLAFDGFTRRYVIRWQVVRSIPEIPKF
jgi:hypothetical protein